MSDAFRPPSHLMISGEDDPRKKWDEWIQQFNLYVDIQTATYSEKQKVSLLLYSMGPEYIPIYRNFDFTSTGDEHKMDVVKLKFEQYFKPKKLLKKWLTTFQCKNSEG